MWYEIFFLKSYLIPLIVLKSLLCSYFPFIRRLLFESHQRRMRYIFFLLYGGHDLMQYPFNKMRWKNVCGYSLVWFGIRVIHLKTLFFCSIQWTMWLHNKWFRLILIFSIQCIGNHVTMKRDLKNYLLWRDQFIPFLISNGFLKYVDGLEPVPLKLSYSKYNAWFVTNQYVVSLIKGSLFQSACPHVKGSPP